MSNAMKMLLFDKYWFGSRTTKFLSQKRRRHLAIFCIRFLWRGGPIQKKEKITISKEKPSSGILHRSNCNWLWLRPNYKRQWSEPDCLARKSLSWYYVGLGGSRTKAWVVVLHSVSWDPHNNNQGWKEDSLRNSLRSLGLASKSPAAAAKTSFSCSYLWNGTFQRRGQQQAKSLVNTNFSNYKVVSF